MKHKCSICGTEFTGFGNNPAPFEGESCCSECDWRWVIPARIVRLNDPVTLNILVEWARIAEMFRPSKVEEEMRKACAEQ